MVDPTFSNSVLDSINETLANDELDNSQREDLMKARERLEQYTQKSKPAQDFDPSILSALLRLELRQRLNSAVSKFYKGTN